MKIVRDRVLADSYDVVVVGAGLGGMTAAGLLAKRGLSVLMLEQQDKPGGSCTSFRRDGITFDVGTAMLYGFGERGFRPFRFLMNELEEPVEVLEHAPMARMTFEGQPIVFWREIERYLQDLDRLFPGEHDALRAFYRDLYRMYEVIVLKNEVIVPPSEFSPRQGLRRLLAGPLAMIRMQKLLNVSVRSLLDQYFTSEAVINFFDKLCSAYCYTTSDETPAVLAATMFLDNHVGGVYYPAGGAQMLPNKIEKAFERLGGQVLYRTMVDEILLRDGQAYGVRLADGTEIAAQRVVANATVWNLYGKLVRPEHISPERLQWAQGLVPTFPSMTLYMVVDRAALPADIMPWEIFIENRKVIDSGDLTLYINSLVDDTLGPTGKMVIMAIAPNLEKWPAPGSPEDGSPAYLAQKEAQAQLMLDQVEKHFPGFGDHVETMIVGSPTTIERYLLKNWGAVGGPKNALGQHMMKRLHARSEWKNLYICGDSTVMATGAPATTVSGVGAANMVLRDLRLPEYDSRRFDRQYVHIVDAPYRRSAPAAGAPLNEENARWMAALCQGCEQPACVDACPAGVDIPAILRRMEAGNYAGAARELHSRTPFGSLCGTVCPADRLCERACYRRSFAGSPVPIAALLRWLAESAGPEGWPQPQSGGGSSQVAVLGGGAAGLACAYFLAQAGCRVELFGGGEAPPREMDLARHEWTAVERMGVTYHGGASQSAFDYRPYSAFCLLQEEWRQAMSGVSPAVIIEDAPVSEGLPLAEAVAAGRKAAFRLCGRLADASNRVAAVSP